MKTPNWHIQQVSALGRASVSANYSGVPQTIFRNKNTCGWTNTHSLAKVLDTSEVFATMLPDRFFDR